MVSIKMNTNTACITISRYPMCFIRNDRYAPGDTSRGTDLNINNVDISNAVREKFAG